MVQQWFESVLAFLELDNNKKPHKGAFYYSVNTWIQVYLLQEY